jgi:hypothetical protein
MLTDDEKFFVTGFLVLLGLCLAGLVAALGPFLYLTSLQ